jgi:hypothetical protein
LRNAVKVSGVAEPQQVEIRGERYGDDEALPRAASNDRNREYDKNKKPGGSAGLFDERDVRSDHWPSLAI